MRPLLYRFLSSILLLGIGMDIHGQAPESTALPVDTATVEVHTFSVHFPVASSRIVENFSTNAETLARLREFVDSINSDSLVTISHVSVVGSASPEGQRDYNIRLADRRINSLVEYINTLGHFPQIERINRGPDFDSLRTLQSQAPAPRRRYYPQLRYSTGEFTINIISPHKDGGEGDEADSDPEPEAAEAEADSAVAEPAIIIEEEAAVPVAAMPRRRWYAGTNAIGWAMLAGNISVEADLSERLSVCLPVYFSALNYFTSTVKFRTAMVQPELRYWLSKPGMAGHTGWFVGAHAGIGHFNVALGGDTRIQDTDGRHPALGGGLGAGWRKNLGRDGRWKLEFSLGVGVYHVRYDKFDNRPQGPCIEKDVRRTFAGIDKAAISIIYTFGKIR